MVSYRINRPERLLILRYAEEVSVAEWEAAISKAIAECPEVVTYDSLSDARSPHRDLTTDEVRDLVRAVKKMGMQEHPQRSVALTGRLVHFGISRMFEMLGDPDSKVRRFTTDSVVKAADWMGRPEALIRAELDAFMPPSGT